LRGQSKEKERKEKKRRKKKKNNAQKEKDTPIGNFFFLSFLPPPSFLFSFGHQRFISFAYFSLYPPPL